MYLKRLLAFLCCFTLVFCLFPSSAFATGGNGNIDGGGGSMGHGTSSNFWNSGNDGVRITVVDASSGTAVSSPLDFSNRTQKTSLLHFGKVNKLQYLGGAGLSLQSGVAYSCIRPTQSMPTIVSSKGQSNIEAIKRYFCSEYACMMVAQAAGVDYERMIAGEYKLLIEPIAYFTHNGQYYCMTATEAGLYDQMSGGNLRKTMTSLTHKNLPLSMFLEFSDLGISAWTGSTTGKQNNSDIISTLGVGIVWFDEAPPEGEIEAPDVEYRVDTDVITAVTLRTDQDLTPDNPASVTFHILGTTYRVNDIVIPAGDSQVVWVKWHTPSTPQTVTITVSVSGAYTAQDTFVAKIVDLNEHIPPDPVATDTNPGYSVPPLPSETQKLTANWGVWSCYWVPVWVWCDHGEDGGHWVDEGYWEYEYTGYSASISGEMSLMPDDTADLAVGDYILTSKISSVPVSSDVALNSIPSGKVAISLTVKTLASGLSDKLQPGDIIRIYHFLDTAAEVPELRFVKVLSVTDSDGINVDNAKEPTEDEEKQQSATITVLASPEQAKIITGLENDGVAHVALISRNNDKLADELLAEQDKTLQEIYFPETLIEEEAADAENSDVESEPQETETAESAQSTNETAPSAE